MTPNSLISRLLFLLSLVLVVSIAYGCHSTPSGPPDADGDGPDETEFVDGGDDGDGDLEVSDLDDDGDASKDEKDIKCAEEISSLAGEIYSTPQECTAVIRLHYDTMEVLGYQLVCGPYNKPTEEEARGVTQVECTEGRRGRMVSPQDPDDEYIFIIEGNELVGCASVISARTGLLVFEATLAVFFGCGRILQPESWRPANELGSECSSSADMSAARGYFLATGEELVSNEIMSAIDVVKETAIPDAFLSGGQIHNAVVLLYTYGPCDIPVDWIVLVNGGP